jgi:hypothetical protein
MSQTVPLAPVGGLSPPSVPLTCAWMPATPRVLAVAAGSCSWPRSCSPIIISHMPSPHYIVMITRRPPPYQPNRLSHSGLCPSSPTSLILSCHIFSILLVTVCIPWFACRVVGLCRCSCRHSSPPHLDSTHTGHTQSIEGEGLSQDRYDIKEERGAGREGISKPHHHLTDRPDTDLYRERHTYRLHITFCPTSLCTFLAADAFLVVLLGFLCTA